MALSGRSHGKWIQDCMSPDWFNLSLTKTYFAELAKGNNPARPEILIEVHLDDSRDEIQYMLGVHNEAQAKVPGISLRIQANPEYEDELRAYERDRKRPDILPVEWYEVEWRYFSDSKPKRRPKELGVSLIDSKTVQSNSGVDYYTRNMLTNFLEPSEIASVAVESRKARQNISDEVLSSANDRMTSSSSAPLRIPVQLQMDQSNQASWENMIIPATENLPLSAAGQGKQASLKITLAMMKSNAPIQLALIEEPENHLSHTSLKALIADIEALSQDRQTFVTTHSAYVLNRLGLDKLTVMNQQQLFRINELQEDTVKYFQKLSGYDTLRAVLAEKLVLVEGPSDELVFNAAYHAANGVYPGDNGVDVLSVAGVAFKRALELCAALDRSVALMRDNDGDSPEYWHEKYSDWTSAGVREVFVGSLENGDTLEPQIRKVNDSKVLRKVLGLRESTKLESWMSENKTETALRILESADSQNFVYPDYITKAVEFLS